MEELRIKAGELELSASGEAGTIKDVSKDFYNYLSERGQRAMEAGAERIKAKIIWHAEQQDGKRQMVQTEKQHGKASESATLLAVRKSAVSLEELAGQIKSGDDLAVGDKVGFRMKTGEKVTVVFTQSTEEFVRFESVDCVGGKDVPWSDAGSTKCGIAGSDVIKYLNEEIWSQLPEELQAAIDPMPRKHRDCDGNVQEYEFKLFLPAASEVFDGDNCYGDEGLYEQMEYYKDRRNRMKGAAEGEDACSWWLASVRSGYSTLACHVSGGGYANRWDAASAGRVPLCFIIKKS